MVKKTIKKMMPIYALRFFSALLYAGCNALLYIQMSSLIDYVLEGNRELSDAVLRLVINAGVLLLAGLLDSKLYGWYMKKAGYYLRKYYVEKISDKYTGGCNSAEVMSGLVNDLNVIENRLFDGIDTLGNCFCGILVSLWMLTNVNIYIVIVAVVLAVIALLFSGKLLERTNEGYAVLNQNKEMLVRNVKETLNGFSIIKSYLLEEKMQEQYNETADEVKSGANHVMKLNSRIYLYQRVVMNLAIYGTLIFCAVMVYNGVIGIGGILLTVEAISRFVSDIGSFVGCIGGVLTVKSTKERVDALTSYEENKAVVSAVPKDFPGIICNNVSFSYEKSIPVVKDFSFQFEKNKKYMIVGKSGCGKTTLLSLLSGQLMPTEGQVEWHGPDNTYSQETENRMPLGVIGQNTFLFKDSIFNNIAMYGTYEEREVLQALEIVGLGDWAASLPEGIHSMLLNNGENVSGGEKIRIALARAILHQKKVLLLDEVFASLDKKTAVKIEQYLLEMKDVTLISVTHIVYPETREKYDEIISFA